MNDNNSQLILVYPSANLQSPQAILQLRKEPTSGGKPRNPRIEDIRPQNPRISRPRNLKHSRDLNIVNREGFSQLSSSKDAWLILVAYAFPQAI